MKFPLATFTGTLASVLFGGLLSAENWPQLRGPHHNGSSEETGLPTEFSIKENVKWKVDMPGESAATPAVWGDSVFVSSTNEAENELEAWCLDAATGEVRWKKKVAEGYRQDDRSNYASPSPATDGERVAFFYGTGDLVVFDFKGEEVWKKNIQKEYGSFAFLWTFSTSPMIHAGKLYLQVLQRDEAVGERGEQDKENLSYILAFDFETGRELWKVERPSEAKSESREAFTTPVIHEHEGKEVMLVAGGDCLTGHDPETGKELWRWGTWNPSRIGHWRLVPSPVAGDGVAIACAPKKEPVFAVKLGLSGELDDTGLAWTSDPREVSSDVATPAFYQGRFYVLDSDRRSMSCVIPETGKVVWSERLPDANSKFEASPLAADGKLYLVNHRGQAYVLKAGDTFELLHQTDLGEEEDLYVRSTMVAAQGSLFLRTHGKLYCFAK